MRPGLFGFKSDGSHLVRLVEAVNRLTRFPVIRTALDRLLVRHLLLANGTLRRLLAGEADILVKEVHLDSHCLCQLPAFLFGLLGQD